MKRIGPYGDENGAYVQGDASAGVKGSYIDYRAIEHAQLEIVHVIEQAGLSPSSSDLTQLYQAIAALIVANSNPNAAPPGKIAFFAKPTAPTGWLKSNGAAVLRTTYSALDTAIYCGDSLNATALFGYRCTDPANPSTSRSTTGAYIVTPDIRAEFVRGFDDGRGIDASRVFGSWQKGTLQGVDYDGTGSYTIQEVGPANGYSGIGPTGLDTIDPSNYSTAWGRGADTAGNGAINNYGFGSTRPRNIALLPCIKY